MLSEFRGVEVVKVEMGLDARSKLILCQDEYRCFKIVTLTLQ